MHTLSRQVDLPFRPESVRAARAIVRTFGAELADDTMADAELLVSEVVTNAVRHGGPDISLTVEVEGGSVTIGVTDGSNVMPMTGTAVAATKASGRGLLLVDQVAAAWGVTTHSGKDGKTVWFRLADRSGGEKTEPRKDEAGWI
ncbi:ATP-binding protein [Nocardioides sp. Kera G14]|uniref:ATP-binding protein n=1 Tax=Nocardioides sp. Kera G14 TaxID=2884264 RepID=UPI001D11E54B|nr:ATP-binding protein [Nocardioides sp. Kera G14]UDY25084.1 ATP-binding protein [Nocardioides sp. Kera G14]